MVTCSLLLKYFLYFYRHDIDVNWLPLAVKYLQSRVSSLKLYYNNNTYSLIVKRKHINNTV